MKRIGGVAQEDHQRRQALDVLAMDFHQFQTAVDALLTVDGGVRRLDQRGLAHAAGAPQKRVVGRQAAGEALGVFDQEITHPVDPPEKFQVDAVDAVDRGERPALRPPDEGLGRAEIRLRWGLRREALERIGDAAQEVGGVSGGLQGKSAPWNERRFATVAAEAPETVAADDAMTQSQLELTQQTNRSSQRRLHAPGLGEPAAGIGLLPQVFA